MAFNQWKAGGHQRACIMTEELVGYMPLSSGDYQIGGKLLANTQQKVVLFKKIASLIQAMHQHNFQHDCFYLEHIFSKSLPNNDVHLRVIDLKKAKKLVCKKRAVFRDLDTLLRHSNSWSDDDKLVFFQNTPKGINSK